MPTRTRGLRRLLTLIVAVFASLALLISIPAASSATSQPAGASLATKTAATSRSGNHGTKPTIVLVHGAFADASGFGDVINRLQRAGYTVIAPANPLRSVAGDAAYLASVLAQIPGPIVIAGHSYGGEVMTNAATGNPNVKALVYIAAFAPDQGETSGQLSTMYPGSQLTPDNLVFRGYPISDTETGTDAYINPAKFRAIFCADLPASKAAVMGASQRPGSLNTLTEQSGAPAWKTIPSWYLVAKQDQAIPPAAQRFMAKRMKARTLEINSSHVAMTSHPDITAALIIAADRTTR